MATTEEYRGKAIACEKMAKEVTDRAIRDQWQELAINWHYMANQAARLEEMFPKMRCNGSGGGA
jgi:hypothetical protein